MESYDYVTNPDPVYLKKLILEGDTLVQKFNNLLEKLVDVDTNPTDLDVEYIDDNKVKLTYNGANNYSNGNWYFANAGYNYVAAVLSSTFTLTADSKIRPTRIELTDDENPDNVLIVTATPAGF